MAFPEKRRGCVVGNGEFARLAVESCRKAGITIPLIISSTQSSLAAYWCPNESYKGITISTPSINTQAVYEELKKHEIDFAFVVGWHELVRAPLLDLMDWYGFHPTKLPSGRGRAPIPSLILNGVKESAVSFFKIEAGVDNGELIAQIPFQIDDRETATTLYDKIGDIVYKEFKDLYISAVDNRVRSWPQLGTPCYYMRRTPGMSKFLFSKKTADEIDVFVRALTDPYPNAYATFRAHSGVEYECSFVASTRVDSFPSAPKVGCGHVIGASSLSGTVLVETCDDSVVCLELADHGLLTMVENGRFL